MKRRVALFILLFAFCLPLVGCSLNQSQAPEIGYFLVSDFEGKAVGILENSGLEESIKDRVPGAKIKTYPSLDEAASALKSYKVQGLFLDASSAAVLTEKDDSVAKVLETYIENQLVIASKYIGPTAEGEFRMVIDATLTRLRNNGGYTALLEKYFGGEPPQDVDIEFNQTSIGRELNIGVLANCPPYSYKTQSGEWAGFDIELANEIAKSYGATPVFKEYAAEQMIEALNKDDIRIAFGQFTTADGEAWDDPIGPAPYFDTSVYIVSNVDDVGINPLAE